MTDVATAAGGDLPTPAAVRAAADALQGRVHRTPLLSSATLSRLAGAPVLLKAELLQRSGSFKIRGAMNRVGALSAEERARGVITVSAGNHAQAVALAASEHGVDALVLMPRNASEAKVAATRAYGAALDLESADAAEAFARMSAISEQTGRVILHPFDDALVIAGQGTVALECIEEAPEADVFLAPVSGGGLVSGIALAVKALRPNARVIAVEAANTGALRASLAAGHPVTVSPSPTIADALTAPTVGGLCLGICRDRVDEVVSVTEDELRAGLRFVYQRTKLACEAAGAAPVAALIAGKVDAGGSTAVVAVVSGGNISEATLIQALAGAPGRAGGSD